MTPTDFLSGMEAPDRRTPYRPPEWPSAGCGSQIKGAKIPPAAVPRRSCLSSSLDPLESPSQVVLEEIGETAKITPGLDLKAPYYGRPEFDPQPNTAVEETFRHSGWADRRNKVFKTMQSFADSRRQQAFAECGANMWLQRTPNGDDMRIVSTCCHDRFCAVCAATRARRLNANLSLVIKGKHVRFITLTLRAGNTPLLDQLKRLYLCFATLRRRAFWKEGVTGGAAFCEVKLGSQSGLWHCHLHILCEGSFLHQKTLSQEWHAVTGDSSIVDVRAVRDPETAIHYVTKYVTKPATSEVFATPDRLQEFMIALKGRRLVLPFGTWAKLKLTEIPPDGREWTNVMSMDRLLQSAADGDPEGQRYFVAARRKWPHYPWPNLDIIPPPDPNQLDLPL